MTSDQGYIGSHWTPPSGDYSFRIASAAARVTINKRMMQHAATLMAILVAVAVRRFYPAYCPMEEVRGFPKSH
jgi:hypothetical protein